MAKTKAGKWTAFGFNGSPGSEVSVAGTFNGWSPTQAVLKDRKGDGTYAGRILLAPGRHEYKFIVDGAWQVDPTCEESVPDGHGGTNSVVTVG